MAIGVVFLAAAFALVIFFDRRWFQSEGSAAGLFLFAVYAGVVGVLAFIGLWFFGAGLGRLSRNADGTRNYAKAALLGVGIPFVMLAAVQFGAFAYILWLPNLDKSRPQGPTIVSRTVAVPAEYRVAWKSRDGAAAVEWLFQAADFPLPLDEREVRVGETADGPIAVDLDIASDKATLASLRLHRHDGIVEDEVFDALEGKAKASPGRKASPAAFWVEPHDGRWKFLGFACAEGGSPRCYTPEAPLARWLPMAFGLQRVALHVAADRSNARCNLAFRYQGRVAIASTREACGSEASAAALQAAVDVLARGAADARNPPDAAERAKREAAAVARCEGAARAIPAPVDHDAWRVARQRAESTCDFAQRLAAQRLPFAAAEAAPSVLRAMQAKASFQSSTRFHGAQQVVEALASAGPRHPDAVRAQVLRAAWLRERGPRDAARDSLDSVVPLAAEVLAPEDPALDTLDTLTNDLDEAGKARHLAMMAARHGRAMAAGAGTPLEIRTRYRLCVRRTYWNLERETLGECADVLRAAWTAHPDVPPFDRPQDTAMTLADMYRSHAWAGNDFAGGATRVGALRDEVAPRLPPGPASEASLGKLAQVEAELAAKAAAPTPHAPR